VAMLFLLQPDVVVDYAGVDFDWDFHSTCAVSPRW
jgi:hypothetical protein